jgi:two-component system sensor histidine kinase VicK
MYGIEYTINKTLQTLSKVKYRFDNYSDVRHPSIIVTTEPLRKAFIDVKNRGVKTRFITEITKDNLHYCKGLLQVVSEVRHLDGVRGNFAVTDTEYVPYAVSEEVIPSSLTQLVRSTSKEFVEQQQYFFETLWNKAIPAEKKIREIEEGIPAEVTEIWYGADSIAKKQLKIITKAQATVDYCHSSESPSIIATFKPFMQTITQLNKRGVKQRYITEITEGNVRYCKELAKYIELRHLDRVQGTLGIIDGKIYGAIANTKENHLPTEFIYSNVKSFIDQQQYFFETLWNKAIPAKERFKEIEEGAKREFVETIRDPSEIQNLGFDLIKKAEDEILILFSTAHAFHRQEKSGALQLLKEAASRGAKVRILVPLDNPKTEDRVQKLREEGEGNSTIDIRDIKKPLQSKLTTMIVDQTSSLTVELKDDDSKEDPSEAMGLATFSNSESTVMAYASIFGNIWMQTELHH